MRKIYAALLSLFLIFTFNSKLEAQAVATYVFSPSAGTYTPLAGATTSTATSDDGTQNVAIGFNFVFGGVTYTNAVISTNGAIKLAPDGTTTFPSGWINSLSNGYGAAIVGPAWDDNNATGGSVVYLTTGSAPNRTFSVEWINIHLGGGGSTSTPTGTFQLTLTESSNTVRFVYGTINPLTNSTISIGLNDLVSFLSVTPGTPATASSATADDGIGSAINLTSGTTYTFLPPPPCVAPPGGGTTNGPAGVCPGASFNLSVTGSSFGTGLTYQWESSADNTNWFPIVAGTLTGLNTSTFVNTYYRRKITCSGIDGYSSSLLITVSAPVPLPVNEGFNTSGTTVFPTCWSQQFVVGTGNISFQTSSSFPSTTPFEGTRYVYWNAFNIGNNNETRLVSPAIATTGAASIDVQFYWFNENSPFYNSDEFLLEGVQVQYSLNGTTWIDAGSFIARQDFSLAEGTAQWKFKKITLPAAAGNQPVILVGFKFHSSFGDNCSLDAVSILETPPCVEPSGLTVTTATPNSAALSWTASPANPANGYQWEVRESGAAGSGAAGLAASGVTAAGVTTDNATGLTGNATYNYYVRSDCGGSTFSIWAGPFTFTTPCDILPTPFVESFTTYATTFPPACWTENNAVNFFDEPALTGSQLSAYGAGLGSAKFDFYFSLPGTVIELTSAEFAPTLANYFLTFDHAYATYLNGEVDQLEILYSTNGGGSYSSLITYDGGNGGPLNTGGVTFNDFAPNAAQWANKMVALPVGTNKLIFRGISEFGNNLFLDNIQVASCLVPSGLTLTSIAPTSAGFTWTASPSVPANGYQWEVRTSGVGGSGAAGLATSGATAAGVTTANTPGLTPFTTYSFYVRANCGGADFSVWIGPIEFTTPCSPPLAIPFTENFADYATTFPPTCWLINNTTELIGDDASANGIGLGSAKFDFYNASFGTNLDLVSPLFTPVPVGYGLVFDHAYATYINGELDSLRILYSTNGGASYSNLISYAGGGSGPLNTFAATGGGTAPPFSPTASQWATKGIALPAGTNRLLFRGISGFGNNLFLDNITLVTCVPPANVSALGISSTIAQVSFTSTGTQFIVEYGPPGFVPGTTNTAGVGGTLVFGGGSPINVTALIPSTAYDFYVRRICVPGVEYSVNIKATATTLCPATNVPYLQNFESSSIPAMPTCTSVQDINGRSGSFRFGTGAGSWETYTDPFPQTYVSPSTSLIYIYDYNDLSRPADDWFYTQGLNLTAGTSYRLKFFYKAIDGANFPEKLEVKYGQFANAADMTTGTLFTNNNITSIYDNAFDSVRVDFTPPTTGVYYIGFHINSDPDEFGLLLDDVSVKVAPLVDVGITGVILPSLNCPTNGVFVQATITNYNLTTVNFATYPVTVTANITGAGTGVLSTVLNAGTLAPGASMSIYLSPAFNFSTGGVYDITVATSTPNDPETANNSYSTSVIVNPNPATPVITPAAPQICIGIPVQLNTQFTASPPPVNHPVVSSGTISIPIPDDNPAGMSHTLTVSGIPANASITAISVTLNATHTWNDDLIFNLRAPNGNRLNLVNRKGGNGDGFTNCIINSTSTSALPSGNTTVTGTFAPDGAIGVGAPAFISNVATFGGLYSRPNGNWTLAVNDNFLFADLGDLTSWSIAITWQVITPVITWTPVTGLYTNAAATTAYASGANAYSVFANPAITSTYTVTATTLAGCTASTAVTVAVNPFPVITIGSIPDTVCISDPVIPLVASPVGGFWTGPGVSGTNFIPPATSVGTYTLTYSYTNNFGCLATATKKIVVKDCPERMILLRDNAVLLYPNPNNGQFNIKINSVLYNYLTMKVYTNDGLLVRTQQYGGLAWGRVVPIDLTNLPSGVYMVKFYYDGGVRTSEKTFKVIVAR